MNLKVIFVIVFYLIGVLSAKEKVEPGSKGSKGKGNKGDSNRPTYEYTDDEIIALIKQELKERKEMHEYFEFTSTMPIDYDFSSTLESFDDSKSKDKNNKSKDKKNKYGIDDLESKAWNIFGDDIPSILQTINKISEAKQSLNNYNKYENTGEYIENIKNKMDELLENYNIVYSQTNELIELIGNIYVNIHQNDNLQRLLLNENSGMNNNNKYDSNLNEIENEAWKTFGADIIDIKKTMKEIKDIMSNIQYFDLSEEYKLRLKNKMMEILNSYDNIIRNTNELIEMIKGFYIMSRNNS